jgi:membrane-associated phospholipid phosphatase
MMHLPEAIQSIDVSIYTWLGGFAGNWVLDRLAGYEEGNPIFKGGLFLAVYWFSWFRIGPDRTRRRGVIVTAVIGALVALIVARTISFVVPFRVRPMFDPAVIHPQYSMPITAILERWSAFPSDTASLSFALAFGTWYLLRRLAVPIMVYVAGWICLPRMYLGIHYASDIVAGAAIGVATVWVLLSNKWFQSSVVGRIVAFEKTSAHWFYAIAFLVCFEMASLFDDIRNAGRAVLQLALRGSQHGFTHGDTEVLIVYVGAVCFVLIICLVTRYVSAWYRKPPGLNVVPEDSGSVVGERGGNR